MTPIHRRPARRSRVAGSRRGQALVEFALTLPVLILLLVGIIDFGRAVWAVSVVSNAAREAARYAIVHGGSPSNLCPMGPPDQETVIPAPSASCPDPSPSREGIRDVAEGFAISGGDPLVVTVCYGAACSGDTDTLSTNKRGTPVTVRVASGVSLTLPSLFGFERINFSSATTMLVNH